MKASLTGLLLFTLSVSAWAQPGNLTDAQVSEMTSLVDPAKGELWYSIRLSCGGYSPDFCRDQAAKSAVVAVNR